MRFSTTAALLGLAVSGVVAAPFAEAEAEANGLSRRWQICFGEHGHCWDQGGKEEKCPPPPKKCYDEHGECPCPPPPPPPPPKECKGWDGKPHPCPKKHWIPKPKKVCRPPAWPFAHPYVCSALTAPSATMRVARNALAPSSRRLPRRPRRHRHRSTRLRPRRTSRRRSATTSTTRSVTAPRRLPRPRSATTRTTSVASAPRPRLLLPSARMRITTTVPAPSGKEGPKGLGHFDSLHWQSPEVSNSGIGEVGGDVHLRRIEEVKYARTLLMWKWTQTVPVSIGRMP